MPRRGRPVIALAMSGELLAKGGTAEDRLLAATLEGRGVTARPIAWDAGETTAPVDGVLIRSTWDYHRRPEEFRAWLRGLEAAGVAVVNPVPLLLWNVDKRYLVELDRRGVPGIATLVRDGVVAGDLPGLRAELGSEVLVVKPAIGATAYGCRRIVGDGDLPVEGLGAAAGPWLVQPLVEEIATEGEWSILVFAGVASHAVLKRPANGDFRVQADFGGGFERRPLEPALVRFAERVLAALDVVPTYARVDVVRHRGEPRLMELEVIEPQLFLTADGPGLQPFVDAVLAAFDGALGL